MTRSLRSFLRTLLAAAFLIVLVESNRASGKPPEPRSARKTRVAGVVDLSGQATDPFPALGKEILVFIFVRADCPVSNRYAPEIRRLHDRFTQRGIVLRVIYAVPDEPLEKLHQHAQEYQLPLASLLADLKGELARRAGAKFTPEAAVYDRGGALVYRGRIDDRFPALNQQRVEATQRDLEAAIKAVLAGRVVKQSRTKAVGCPISLPSDAR